MNYLTYVSRSHLRRESCDSSGMRLTPTTTLRWTWVRRTSRRVRVYDAGARYNMAVRRPVRKLSRQWSRAGTHADEVSWIIYDYAGQFIWKEKALIESLYFEPAPQFNYIWERSYVLDRIKCHSDAVVRFNCISSEWHIRKTKYELTGFYACFSNRIVLDDDRLFYNK